MKVYEYQKKDRTLFGFKLRKRSSKEYGIDIQKKREGFETRREAEIAMKKLEKEVILEMAQRENAGYSWLNLFEGYAAALHDGTASDRPILWTTAADNIRALEMYCESLNKLPAAQVTKADILSIFSRMKEAGFSKSRMKAVKSAINGAFRWGIETRRVRGISHSPAEGIVFKKADLERKKPPILMLSEIRKFLEAAREFNHPWFPIWMVAFHTGARSGELIALKWKNIDFESNLIQICESYNGRMKGFKSTKGGYWREVPMNEQLREFLLELKNRSLGSEFVLPHHQQWLRGEAARVTRAFCISVGVNEINFHATRACFATQLLRNNVPAATVMKICGWTELDTMQRYIRLAGVEITGATASLDFLKPESAIASVVNFFASK